MSQTLRDFIAQREAEVRAQIAKMQSELRELQSAKRAINGAAGGKDASPPSGGKATIKDKIRDVLAEHTNGGTSDDIIKWVKSSFGTEVPRTSMSPQLSRLKSEGVVTLNNSTNVWQLAEHASKRDLGFLPEENSATDEGSPVAEPALSDAPLNDQEEGASEPTAKGGT